MSSQSDDETVATTNGQPTENEEVEKPVEFLLEVGQVDADWTHCTIRSINESSVSKATATLKTLGLRQNLLTSIDQSAFALLTNLTSLDLRDNQLTKIESIQNCVNLTWLDLSYNRIRKIENLETLIQLESLYLECNKIPKIENIDTLSRLKVLELGNNRIVDIENLTCQADLQELYLGKNRIKTISTGLTHMSKLRILSLQWNILTRVENLDALIGGCLEELYLSENGLTSFDGISFGSNEDGEKCSDLQILDLSDNKLSSFDGIDFTKFPKLTDLWLGKNKFELWQNLNPLKNLKALETLYLEHNPLYFGKVTEENEKFKDNSLYKPEDTNYRRKMMLLLPSLVQLDATKTR